MTATREETVFEGAILVAGTQPGELSTLVSVLESAGYGTTATAELAKVEEIVSSGVVRGAVLDLESSESAGYEALD